MNLSRGVSLTCGLWIAVGLSLGCGRGRDLGRGEPSPVDDVGHDANGNVIAFAYFDHSEPEGSAPLAVALDGTLSYTKSTGAWIARFAWDFGDGTSGVGGWVTHVYSAPGEYTARLTVTDSRGQQASTTLNLRVHPPAGLKPPVAVIASDKELYGTSPLTQAFDGTSSYPVDPGTWIVDYHWDFGDGTFTEASTGWVKHNWSSGIYRVILTVTDNRGLKDSTSVVLQVTCEPYGGACPDQRPLVLWSRQLPATATDDVAVDLQSDSAGRLITAVNHVGAADRPGWATVGKYIGNGRFVWELNLNPAARVPPGNVALVSVAVTTGNALWAAGHVDGRLELGSLSVQDTDFLLRISADGVVERALPGISALRLAADGAGNVYAVSSAAIRKLAFSGEAIWTKSYSDTTIFSAIADSQNNLVVVGQQAAGAAGSGGMIMKLAPSGSTLWTKRLIPGPSFVGPAVRDVAVGPNDQIVGKGLIVGYISIPWAGGSIGAGSSQLGFLVAAGSDGSELWSAQFDANTGRGVLSAGPGSSYVNIAKYDFGTLGMDYYDWSNGALAKQLALSPGYPEVRAPIVPIALTRHPRAAPGAVALIGNLYGNRDFGAGPYATEAWDAFLLDVAD